MEGRWASLTLDAHLSKALDFSYVSQDNPDSLLQESLVHSGLIWRRQVVSRIGQVLYGIRMDNLSDSSRTQMAADSYFELVLPWVAPKAWNAQDIDMVKQYFGQSGVHAEP